ncbi:hypothetical protein LCGC14_0221660 [marine sediment metagenome]|uniref:Nucleotide-diphospho-sugar transferase domain-containing protein n=1 Tax=marine sediment metagenome TaxID=412755 RepID=A0A0F9XHA7_9ZZZZ
MTNETIGLYYVALGTQYDYQCAHSVALVRRYSKIQVRVITDLTQDQRCDKWDDLTNVSFTNVEVNRNKNRYYKIRPDLFSPFDITLFCDTDTAVQSAEFLGGFITAQNYDVMFSVYERIERDRHRLPMPWLYGKFMKPEDYPATIYKEGVFFFRKTKNTIKLFKTWEHYWRLLGCGRDMPALFPATTMAKNLNLGILPPGWDNRNGHIIVHAFGNYKVDGLPIITKYKPDDMNQGKWSEQKKG